MDVEGRIATDGDNWVWDFGSSLWVKMAQPVQDGGDLNVDVTGNTIGLATSAKQLADGHNVTVDNIQVDGTIVVPALVEIDIFHYAIHAGLGFYRTIYSADIDGSEITMAFKTPAVATAQIHMLAHFTASAQALVTVYEGGDLAVSNAGDDVAPINRRRYGSPPVSLMSGYDTGAWVANKVTANGVLSQTTATVLDQIPVGAGRKEGGEHDASWELVLASETVYGFHFDDLSGATNVAHMTASWFEVPPA